MSISFLIKRSRAFVSFYRYCFDCLLFEINNSRAFPALGSPGCFLYRFLFYNTAVFNAHSTSQKIALSGAGRIFPAAASFSVSIVFITYPWSLTVISRLCSRCDKASTVPVSPVLNLRVLLPAAAAPQKTPVKHRRNRIVAKYACPIRVISDFARFFLFMEIPFFFPIAALAGGYV